MELAILLATYNSQTYLRAQIESLLNQSYNDFILYIRDDGSNDQTLSIIEEYCRENPKIVLLKDPISHRKSMENFMWLLEHVTAQYYMFCDHDDVWLSNKVELTLKRMQEIEIKKKPALVCSDLVVVNEKLQTIAPSFWNYMKLRPQLLTQKKYAISCNLFTGCTMMINEAAKKVALPLGKYATMHDGWIGLQVIAHHGIIDCINQPLILYRQHRNNVCGAQEVSCTLKYYKYKLSHIRKVFLTYKKNYLMAKEVFPDIFLFDFLFGRIMYLLKR